MNPKPEREVELTRKQGNKERQRNSASHLLEGGSVVTYFFQKSCVCGEVRSSIFPVGIQGCSELRLCM